MIQSTFNLTHKAKNDTPLQIVEQRFHATYTEQCIGITFTVLLMVLTIIINLFVITTIVRRKPAFNNSYIFMINLCAANCSVGVFSMPWWIMLELYPFKELMARLGYFMNFFTFVDILCGVASILNLTVISVVRWLTVTNPLNWMAVLTRKTSLSIIICVWLYGIVVASMKFVRWPKIHSYSLFVFVLGFVIPFTILGIAYGRMFFLAKYLREPSERAWKTKYTKECEQVQILRSLEWNTKFQRNFRGSKTIAIVTGTFLLSWLPFFAISLCFSLIPGINYSLALAAKWLGYTNAPLSPVVYTLLDQRLKRAVMKSVRSMKHCICQPLTGYFYKKTQR
ncbi:octopamine receptor 1 isoform X2 [Exaiptasia diaphana]|nr:octopamine receptor 1 isoform X2 [Exaiptasia diaphana]KXJ27768.1 Alpha-1A adrenergic receptor [Exaiptasia diaphana]